MNYLLALLTTYIPLWSRKAPNVQNLRGYGRVNYWYTDKGALRKDLARCASEGVKCYHIEYSGWADTLIYSDPKKIKQARKMYKWLLRRCRALGMWLFVSVVNDNVGSRKYGDGGIPLINFYGDIVREIDFIKKQGKKNVIIQPSAETHTDAGRSTEAYCQTKMRGWALCYNGNYGQPKSTGGMLYRAYHPSNVSKISSEKSAIISSDHGEIIRFLHNGSYDGEIDHLKAQAFFNAANGAPMAVVYHFLRVKHDENTIKIIGRV